MISYFIVAHCSFMTNFSSKLKSQFQVIFSQDSFPLNMHPSLASLLQSPTNCLCNNGWRNACFYHYSFQTKKFPSLLARAWFVIKYLSFVKQIVLVVFSDFYYVIANLQYFFSYAYRCLLLNSSSMILSLIFMNRFFLHIDIDSAS